MRQSNECEKKTIFFLEGNIASGKSTLIESLKLYDFEVFEEPVEEWLNRYKEDNGDNILGLFYDDMARWSFQFEVAIMTTRYQKLKEAIECDSNFVFCERSLWTDRLCFAENLYSQGKMTEMEWKIYVDWFDTFMDSIKHLLQNVRAVYVHLKTDPEVCSKRMLIRKRAEEDAVPLEYLQMLHEKHCAWLDDDSNNDFETITLNGNRPHNEVLTEFLNLHQYFL